MSAYVSAVIVAAGGSVRMGIADSKQFIPLLDKPAIEYTLKAFQKCYLIKEIVIVCREQDVDRINELVNQNGIYKGQQSCARRFFTLRKRAQRH